MLHTHTRTHTQSAGCYWTMGKCSLFQNVSHFYSLSSSELETLIYCFIVDLVMFAYHVMFACIVSLLSCLVSLFTSPVLVDDVFMYCMLVHVSTHLTVCLYVYIHVSTNVCKNYVCLFVSLSRDFLSVGKSIREAYWKIVLKSNHTFQCFC